jgi:hypothetical protein
MSVERMRAGCAMLCRMHAHDDQVCVNAVGDPHDLLGRIACRYNDDWFVWNLNLTSREHLQKLRTTKFLLRVQLLAVRVVRRVNHVQ